MAENGQKLSLFSRWHYDYMEVDEFKDEMVFDNLSKSESFLINSPGIIVIHEVRSCHFVLKMAFLATKRAKSTRSRRKSRNSF